MRKLILTTLFIGLLSFSTTFAQNRAIVLQEVERVNSEMQKLLSLSDTQLIKIREINTEYYSKMLPLSTEETLETASALSKLAELRKQRLAKVLTSEQYRKYFSIDD